MFCPEKEELESFPLSLNLKFPETIKGDQSKPVKETSSKLFPCVSFFTMNDWTVFLPNEGTQQVQNETQVHGYFFGLKEFYYEHFADLLISFVRLRINEIDPESETILETFIFVS